MYDDIVGLVFVVFLERSPRTDKDGEGGGNREKVQMEGIAKEDLKVDFPLKSMMHLVAQIHGIHCFWHWSFSRHRPRIAQG